MRKIFCNFAYNQGVSARAIQIDFFFPVGVVKADQLNASRKRDNSESAASYGLWDYRLV